MPLSFDSTTFAAFKSPTTSRDFVVHPADNLRLRSETNDWIKPRWKCDREFGSNIWDIWSCEPFLLFDEVTHVRNTRNDTNESLGHGDVKFQDKKNVSSINCQLLPITICERCGNADG
jgi:hypothetical protein